MAEVGNIGSARALARRALLVSLASLASLMLACSGSKFAAMGGAGTSAGGVASSSGGSGGSSSGGTAGSIIGPSSGFPATPVLDDFSRVDGAPGLNWIGSGAYSISGQELHCADCGTALLWATPFGAEQEVYATLSGFGNDSSEINLILRAQSDTGCDFIEVLYSPSAQQARLDLCAGGVWSELPSTPLALAPGDQFGARAHADGTVELYANGVVVTTLDASSFPYSEGRIGVDGLGGVDGLHWDDFGGGDWAVAR